MPEVRKSTWPHSIDQGSLVLSIAVLLFVVFSFILPGFLTIGNVQSLLQSVAILGILSLGMAVVVISRGLDLSMIAIMVFSVGWAFALTGQGYSIEVAVALGLAFALIVGALNGVLVAYAEVPSVFATLAMGTMVAGFGRFALVSSDNVYLPASVDWLVEIGTGRVLTLPPSVIAFLVLALIVSVGLHFTKVGHFIYAVGDNPIAARITGISTRPTVVLIYIISAAAAFAAGIVMAATVSTVNTKLYNTTMVYDVILVVVIGGIGLSGGKGSIKHVLIGAMLIGVLLNGMTILNLAISTQNITKSIVLLVAIISDSIFNPRDEQTSQQGDI